MIAELAASEVAVRDYLKMDPLMETLQVSFHGDCNYLPVENFNGIDLLDGEAIEVPERERRAAGVPEAAEKDAHKDFLQ